MQAAAHVAVIQDISGFGRCSMSVALPVLAAMGVQCCPLPTAYLSAHTAFPHQEKTAFLDMSGEMEGTMGHWKALGVELEAIYTGFLGSEDQIGLIGRFARAFRSAGTLVLVDPVMGDHGKPYRTYTPAMCARMRELAARADVITPNLTEAALLLDEPYSRVPTERAGMSAWLERLSLDGRRSVAITGVSLTPGQVGAGCLDRESGGIEFVMSGQEPGQYPGTGDLFASVLLGGLLRGESLAAAAGRAVEFVRACVARTLAVGTPVLEGVEFEPLLGELTKS